MEKRRLSPALEAGLRRYDIGPRIRALRLKKKFGLVALGHHTGLSPALLSKLERGRLFPTLPTLLRIALVFGVGLEYFFGPAAPRHVLGIVRRGERRRFPERPGARDSAWDFECLDFAATERKLDAYWVRFRVPPARLRTHTHAGVEFLYVLRGRLAVAFEDADHTLDPGDAMYFDASHAHGYRRVGARVCEAIVVTVP
jgi:transcriptional regulator with XRE-family HTH domain